MMILQTRIICLGLVASIATSAAPGRAEPGPYHLESLPDGIRHKGQCVAVFHDVASEDHKGHEILYAAANLLDGDVAAWLAKQRADEKDIADIQRHFTDRMTMFRDDQAAFNAKFAECSIAYSESLPVDGMTGNQ